MLLNCLASLIWIAQVMLVPAAEPAPATQPTTQAGVVVAKPGSHEVISRIATGEQRVTLDDVLSPTFWGTLLREAIVWVISFVPRLLVAMFCLLIFYVIYRAVFRLITSSMSRANVDTSIRDMLGGLIKWTILGFGVVIACNQIGVQITALLTGVSIIGLAIGFAAQETLANFIAGIVIFWDKPFKVGDWIEVDGHLGQVRRVTFRSTRLNNLDGDVVVFPNTTLIQNKVVNKSTNPVTRANVAVGIAYKESIDRARQVLLAMVRQDARVEKSPEPEVVVKTLGASSVDLMLHFWIKEERYEDAMQYEYTEKAKEALDAAGIEIPFPHVQMILPEKT